MFCIPHNISEASQQNSAATSSKQLQWMGTCFKTGGGVPKMAPYSIIQVFQKAGDPKLIWKYVIYNLFKLKSVV